MAADTWHQKVTGINERCRTAFLRATSVKMLLAYITAARVNPAVDMDRFDIVKKACPLGRDQGSIMVSRIPRVFHPAFLSITNRLVRR